MIYCSAPYVKNKEFKASNRYLFKGLTSYPISPNPELKGTDNPIDENDQIYKILSRFPNLDAQDFSFISTEPMRNHQSKLFKRTKFELPLRE